jgi:hypothetical protein
MKSKKKDEKIFSLSEFYNFKELTPDKLKEIYPVIASRRLQWDNLAWQVPMISITGESFLFTIILSSSTSKDARIIGSLLAIIISYASISTLGRHRISEVHDANILREIEAKLFGISFHGPDFSKSRGNFFRHLDKQAREKSNKKKLDLWDFVVRASNRGRSYPVWLFVFLCFFVAALVCLILAISSPNIFLV